MWFDLFFPVDRNKMGAEGDAISSVSIHLTRDMNDGSYDKTFIRLRKLNFSNTVIAALYRNK